MYEKRSVTPMNRAEAFFAGDFADKYDRMWASQVAQW